MVARDGDTETLTMTDRPLGERSSRSFFLPLRSYGLKVFSVPWTATILMAPYSLTFWASSAFNQATILLCTTSTEVSSNSCEKSNLITD